MKKFICSALFAVLCALCLAQQKFDYDGHTRRMYDNALKTYDFAVFGPSRLDEWRCGLRSELSRALGLDVIERCNPGFRPEAVQLDNEDIGYAVRQRWTIRTEEDVWLPFVMILPKNIQGPVPLMITPHGHAANTERGAGIYVSEEDRRKGEEGERNIAVQAALQGFIAIAPTERGFGETRMPDDIVKGNTSSCRDLMLRDLLVGRTPVGDRVWDVMKILDWALANLPVDATNVVVSGNSGGGTVSLYAGALDERISMTLPGAAFAEYEGSIGFRRHCECNYIPGILNLCEAGDVAGLIAPRAFCAVNGVEDTLFPIASARKAFERTRQIYSAAGAESQCSLYEGNGGHRYYKKGAWDFILRHLVK